MDKFVGKILDRRYEIKEVIGVGGMAVVYKAYDKIDDRTVAVKILKEEFINNEDFCRRFKNESKAIAVLSHPNIVKVYDVSFGDRLQYIVMEHIDGISLKEYIERQKEIKWKESVYFVVQILRALQHAHDKGIVHRDIKPQNIMLIQDGTIKVTDFGIARFSRSDQRTVTDKAIGSVHYIAPEQARGDITDEKADIYSVGVLLYEMLTGRLPFEADTAVSVAIMQLQNQPKMPRDINDTIPEGLEEITIKAMQKDSSVRYQSAAEMLRDIDEFKKNPSVKFEYKYFIDEPTKYVDGLNKPKEVDEVEPEQKSYTMPILAGVTVAFVIGAIILLVIAFNSIIGGGGEEIKVPELVNKSYTEIYEEWGTTFKFNDPPPREEFSSTVPAGCVISQKPLPGLKVKKNSKIELVISKGPKTVKIQDVYGHELLIATATLENQGLIVNVRESFDETELAPNYVISTEPERLTEVAEGTTVTVIVNRYEKGLVKNKVPDLSGLDQSGAEAQVRARSFVPKVERQYSNSIPKGFVISQSPSKNADAYEGSTVTIYVSDGIEPVESVVSVPAKKTVTVTLPLPTDDAETIPETIYLRIYVDGVIYKDNIKYGGTSQNLKLIDTISVEIEGTGSKAVAIFVSDKMNNFPSGGSTNWFVRTTVNFDTQNVGYFTPNYSYFPKAEPSVSSPPSSSSHP